ncbi:nuclear transport factor 2 family protein [Psychroserpens sp. BH13MA-6]
MKSILLIVLLVPIFGFSQDKVNLEKMSLSELNEYLFIEYTLNKNTEPLNTVATEDFVLIAAPGMIETKEQAIKGVNNLSLSSVNVTVDNIIERDNLGIVIGVLDMKGTIMGRPIPGKIRYHSVFFKDNGIWQLQSRSMTPIRM